MTLSAILLVKVYSGRTEVGLADQGKMIGRNIPAIELQDILSENSKVKSTDFLGRYTVLNFFSSWCTTCRIEQPILLELSKTGKFQVFGIAWRDKKEDTLVWIGDLGNPFDKIGYDNTGKYGISMGITGIPETFVINEKGVIVGHYVGDIKPEFLLELEKLSGIKFVEREKTQKKDTD